MDEVNGKRIIDYKPNFRGGKCYAFFKRLFDIVTSFLGIILLSPLMLVIIIMIEFTFDGHCVYVDKRAGKGGKTINVLKFRTMYKDAEDNVDAYLTEDQKKQFESERKVKDDPRVTWLGSFLRKSSLDELPQLFNILIGDMSFVGPRAVTHKEIEDNFSSEQAELILKVRPGLTGSWCAYGRYSATYSVGDRQEYELQYLEKRSFVYDMKIIFATFGSVITLKDAKSKEDKK